MSGYRVTVDTGGTFSDFVCHDEATGRITIAKVPSTPHDPSEAILAGLRRLIDTGVPADRIGYFCHGTTVGTNALLEGKGAHTGLLVTEGFRGIYEVGEQARPHGSAIFDVMYQKPARLVGASDTGEVAERVLHDGVVLKPLDETKLRAVLRHLGSRKVESLAICLLFSFLHPAHEQRIREIAAEELPGCEISLSSDVVPQIREYHRLSTTVVNAYLQPILSRYIARLDGRLDEAGIATPRKFIMQSNGGMATFDATARKGVATVLSGPAGGVTAAVAVARATGQHDLVTFDMGGTSCDVALIKNAAPAVANRGKVESHDIAIPMMDINTVSAGGGTLAAVDRFGVLQVGPQSAGAVPGPACYGRCGDRPTITDCNLVLGYLAEDGFLGGTMRLDAKAAWRAVETHVAKPLGLGVIEAAEGIIKVIDIKMEEAIKAISTMRGHDLRDFALLPFGGAGPVHAGRIMRDLGMRSVLIPPYPGVFSAMGLIMSDVRHDHIRSRLIGLDTADPTALNAQFAEMENAAHAELLSEGFAAADIEILRFVDLRYAGQGYEVTVPTGSLDSPSALADLRAEFDRQHEATFGHAAPEARVEIVSFRLQAIGRVSPLDMPVYESQSRPASDAQTGRRKAWFDSVACDISVYDRDRLDVGAYLDGPAVVEQFDCTTIVLPGQRAEVDRFRNLIVSEAI